MLFFFFFFPAVLLGDEAITSFQGSFTFRFLPALSDLNFLVHFAGCVHTQAGQRGKPALNWSRHCAKSVLLRGLLCLLRITSHDFMASG